MLQVVQHQKTGEIQTQEFPAPNCPPEGILVRTAYSLISAGTEKTSVTTTQSSLLERARKQPDQVKQVLDFIKKEGMKSTIRRVRSTLDSYKTPGYSAAGTVIESRCANFSPGDRVACAGANIAVHAELLAVPKNLAVKIPDEAAFEDAAYTTVGTIAMQGVRQADVRLGETVAVIGLGLIGQITVMLLKASGCKVVGLDIDESLFNRSKHSGCDAVYPSSFESVNEITGFTRGLGCDGVIITAGTSSNMPVELAIELARKKGKIVIVGAVSMNLPRPTFYKKELDVRISSSYGPGRYDNDYEERGIDYPPAYVRWTENRNMQAFIDMIRLGKIDIKTLTTHTFKINEAQKAYDLITGKGEEPYLGILLEYPERNEELKRTITISEKHEPKSTVRIGFVGAGKFAQNFLLPPLKEEGVDFIGVSTTSPANAQTVARQYGFRSAATDSSELISNPDINTVFCATRHDTHAKYVIEAVKAGKPVFVEKPLAVNINELREIENAAQGKDSRIMVGFNRRFSGSFRAIADFFQNSAGPKSMIYRVNAGAIPPDHWIQSPEHGGRIIGEACHFIDCMVYLTGSLPVRVFAESVSTEKYRYTRDIVTINIKFADGSTGTVHYFANGDKSVPKEYCELFCDQSTAIMHDFRKVEFHRGGSLKKSFFKGRKGHSEEVKAFIKAVKAGGAMPISFDEIRAVTLAAFAAERSLATGLPVNPAEL